MPDKMIEVIRKSTGGGAQGPKGDPGAAGAPGPGVFLVGEDGEEGPIGPLGLTGPQGAAGSTGNTGASGPTGPAVFLVGEDGEEGVPGPPGGAGVAGATGGAGQTGAQGPTGPAVFLEAEGNDGEMGPPGVAGAAGATGGTGAPGAAGAAGPVGPTGEDGADGEQIIVMGAPAFPFPPNAYGTDVPIVYDDEGTFAVNNTGYLGQRSRLTLTTSEHAVFAGTGRVDLFDQPSGLLSTYGPGSFTIQPDRYLFQYKQLRLVAEQRATLLGNAEILLTTLYPISRLVLVGVGGGT